jgi:hypothetical protein
LAARGEGYIGGAGLGFSAVFGSVEDGVGFRMDCDREFVFTVFVQFERI